VTLGPRAVRSAAALLVVVWAFGLCGCHGVNPAYRSETQDAGGDRSTGTASDTWGDRDMFETSPETAPPSPPPDARLDAAESLDLNPLDLGPVLPDLAPDLTSPDLGPPDLTPDLPPRLPMITLGTPTFTSRHGTDMGNTIHDDRCPAGQALIGYRATTGLLRNMGTPVLTSLAAQCGTLTVDSAPPTTVTVQPAFAFPVRGMPTGQTMTAMCPPDQVVVTFDGRAGSFVDQLRIGCARLTIEAASTPVVTIGAVTRLAAIGGTGGVAFQDGCPAGRIVTGHRLEVFSVVDTMALACALPSATQ
jgi:hypothetical protein